MLSVDKKFKLNKKHYIFQCCLVTVTLGMLFSMLDFFFNTALVAALGATAFIVFTGPHKEISRSRYVVGGYTIGIVVGLLAINGFYYMALDQSFFPVCSALCVGITMFLMVVFDYEHPPAAGVALGLMINNGHPHSVAVAILGIIFVLLMRYFLRQVLIDLI